MLNTELFIGAVYVAGLLSFFSPCIFPLLPVYIGMLSTSGKKSIIKTVVFVIGLSTSFVLLGFGAGSIGSFLMSKTFRVISGVIVIIFGIIQMEIVKIPFLERTKLVDIKGKENDSIWGAFLLGFTFSLGWTPCVGPILASILFISSGGGNPYYGVLMMFIYVLGLATPFVILSLSSKYVLAKVSAIKKHLGIMKKIGGLLIIIMGILLLTDKLSIFL
ncbi:cytochrome c biogenesis CcdA family protein [Fusobacterium periodonticum]|uniref:cytochrome c biogenesis CcdA family protein n=1 Tax=Fusobacterium periodonticum TaxID=860 RepID=UPI00195B82E3|nr:cytochrome c biogenesis CcdA family protein [Fusobacterium periodonticum]VTX82175.1 Thiol:disulfide interchange protein DsbD [Fusobacterium periodonticum]